VHENEALAGLEAATKRYVFRHCFILANVSCRLQFTDTFAFGAEHLITHYPAIWMVSYADQVIISGQPSGDSIGNLLYTSGVGSHTSIVYLNRKPGEGGVSVLGMSGNTGPSGQTPFPTPSGAPSATASTHGRVCLLSLLLLGRHLPSSVNRPWKMVRSVRVLGRFWRGPIHLLSATHM
jgi:hypothetical protein